MGFMRKLAIGLSVVLIIPILVLAFLAARYQHYLVKSTHTVNEISRNDPLFSSPPYQRHFGDREWAKIESFGVAILIPLKSVHPELLENDEVFASEVFRLLWNERMNTQFNGPPSSEPPKVGAQSASDAIRAEVVEVGPTEMAMTITTVPTGYTGGFEIISAAVSHKGGIAAVGVKYIWHNDVLLPRKWVQYIGIYMQLTSRRMWLVSLLSGLTQIPVVEDDSNANVGREPSSRVEL
ncbi:hypothetical protein F5B19DRAFT_232021 [Rostrohypoxylon terebratum]|nr:hypothetical protein F5B19DRAFT_232021 [Rostrohypoxylon terebratum]